MFSPHGFLARIGLFFLAALAVVLITACPYQSEYPLDSASLPLDATLFGKWVKQEELVPEHPSYYTFSKADDTHYLIQEYEWEAGKKRGSYKKSHEYVAHFTVIDGTTFVNMRSGDTFYFSKLDMIAHDEFRLLEVTENITEKFSSSADLKAFFARHKGLSFFYNQSSKALYKKSK